MRVLQLVTAVCLAAVVTLAAGCASHKRPLADGSIARTVDPEILRPGSASTEYRIGPSDRLALSVFQVPDLSFEEIHVDAGGNLQLPLVGSIKAAGLTTAELADTLRVALRERYVRDPQIMISVAQAASQKVTVDGAVTKPGIYEMRGRTTLLQAVAMAEGPTRVADLRSVAVFRQAADGQMVAVFDMRAIRNGQSVDPVLLGDDIVVVDTSTLSARTQEFLQVLPALASFAYYAGQ